jgi:hypothetical protein
MKIKIKKILGLIALLIVCFSFYFCSNSGFRKDLNKGNSLEKPNYADEGLQLFNDRCMSCHHRVKRPDFLWPSVSDLSIMDSIKRNAYLEKISGDTIHGPILKSIGDSQYYKIKCFINSRARN